MHNGNGSWATRAGSRLIVLLSSERSGSTLLRVMLGEHSRIIAPQELFLMRYPDFSTWRTHKPVAIESVVELFFLLGRPLTEAEVDAACRGRPIVAVYQWLFEHLPPGAFLLDKTPAYSNDPATLTRSAALRPFYVWLIRHPLGVIDSHLRLKAKERLRRSLPKRALDPLRDVVERWSSGMPAMARERETKWVQQNLNVRNFLRHVSPDQQAVVHFEDLVREPEAIVRTLCAAIGIPVEPGMARPETRQLMNPALGDPNFHLHGGIEASPAESWQAQYHEGQLRIETLQLMHQLGVLSPRLRLSAGHAA
jgi:hypothetical protein